MIEIIKKMKQVFRAFTTTTIRNKNKYLVISLIFIVIIIIIAFVIFLIYYKSIPSYKEGFHSTQFKKWKPQTVKQFIQFQKTVNPLLVFDMKLLQQQATEKEAINLLTTGMWSWSKEIQEIYKDTIIRDTTRQINPLNVMNIDRTIYNETAIKELLGWKAPEGQFLLNGVFVEGTGKGADGSAGAGAIAQETLSGEGTYGIKSGLISKNQDLIRCYGKKGMQRITQDGNDGITGLHKKQIVNLDYHNLPKIIPGFTFIKGACNPCSALSSPLPNYSCPFTIMRENESHNNNISAIWRNLWGLGKSKYKEPQVSSRSAAFRINN